MRMRTRVGCVCTAHSLAATQRSACGNQQVAPTKANKQKNLIGMQSFNHHHPRIQESKQSNQSSSSNNSTTTQYATNTKVLARSARCLPPLFNSAPGLRRRGGLSW